VKWGTLKLRVVYAMILIASLALTAGANAKCSAQQAFSRSRRLADNPALSAGMVSQAKTADQG
jgi:hypothetical protein